MDFVYHLSNPTYEYSIWPFRMTDIEGLVVPSGFEPESPAPKASMIDHYTTGLYVPPYLIRL